MSNKIIPIQRSMLKDTDQEELDVALIVAGRLHGLSTTLNTDVLEAFLNSKPKGFLHEKTCRNAIAYARANQS